MYRGSRMPLVGVRRWLVGGADSFIHAHFDSGEALWWICPHIENKYRWNDVRVHGRSTSGVDYFILSSSAETNAHTQHTPSRILPLVLSCRLCTVMLIMVVKRESMRKKFNDSPFTYHHHLWLLKQFIPFSSRILAKVIVVIWLVLIIQLGILQASTQWKISTLIDY